MGSLRKSIYSLQQEQLNCLFHDIRQQLQLRGYISQEGPQIFKEETNFYTMTGFSCHFQQQARPWYQQNLWWLHLFLFWATPVQMLLFLNQSQGHTPSNKYTICLIFFNI